MKRLALFFSISCILFSTIGNQSKASVKISSDRTSLVSIIETNDQPEGQPDRSSTFVLKGKIIDSKTGEPLSYATLSINKLGIGTVSNSDGNWTLRVPASGANEKLNIHFMGYVSQTLSIANMGEQTTIRLTPTDFQLAEVVVVPHDFMAELLEKAYKAIPDNYPTQPSMIDGFYRETQRVNDSLFLCFDEAVLNVYKNTYKNAKNFGQIRVEKSRKNVFPGIDSLNDVRFYGGPHFPNDLDIVFSRWDFIRPSEYKNWEYVLGGVYKDNNSSVYTITFYNKKAPNSNFRGTIYIDKDSYAYLGFEIKRNGLGSVSSDEDPSGEGYIPGNVDAKIGYIEKDGKYYLSYINYKTSGFNTTTKTRIYKDIDFITTDIKTDSVKPIPYYQQFDYTDILSIDAQDYDKSYWKDYNVLEQSNMLNSQTNLLYKKEDAMKQLTKVYNTELTSQEKTLLFLKRFTFESSFGYLPVNYSGGMHQVSWGSTGRTAQGAGEKVSSRNFGISTIDGTRFELNKRFSLFSNISAALYGISQVQFDLGANYRTSVFPSGRWFFLDLGLAATTSSSKYDICTIDNPSKNLDVNGKIFDSESVKVTAGNSRLGLKGIAGISVRMGKKYEIFMNGSYILPFIKDRNYVQLKETSGSIFSRKSAKVDWNDPNLNFYIDNQRITSPNFTVEPYQFCIGIRSGF